MSYEPTVGAIFTEVNLFASANNLPVSWPNIQFSPVSTYIRADLMWTNPINGLDSKITQPGVLQLSVVSPDGGGLIKSLEICSLIESYFNIGKKISDISITNVAIENAIIGDGNIFQPVSIYFK